MAKKKITVEDEKELLAVNNNTGEKVQLPHTNKSYNIKYIKGYTHERLSLLELRDGLKDEEDSPRVIKARTKLIAKASSLCILNGLSILFFHWLLWRYLYYVKGYTYEQLEPIVATAKKKVLVTSWYRSTMLLKQMKITTMAMTEEEQEQLQVELSSGLKLP